MSKTTFMSPDKRNFSTPPNRFRIPKRFGGVEKFLLSGDINVVLDIGANVGHFGLDLRKFGFKGKIYSFEPLSTAYNELAALAGKDEYGWKTFNLAVGDTDTISEINIAANSDSSSLRGMLPLHLEIAPDRKSTRLNSSHLGISYAVF